MTLVERKCGYLLTAKSRDRQARRVSQKIAQRLAPLPARLRRTATFDNGKEFAEHPWMAAQLKLRVYFAKPYCSWQRGTNEHTNGLLRPFLPKGTDFRQTSWQELARYTDLLNDRPRKRLAYRTPAEVFEPLIAIENSQCRFISPRMKWWLATVATPSCTSLFQTERLLACHSPSREQFRAGQGQYQ